MDNLILTEMSQERHSVPNLRQLHCFHRFFRQSKKTSKLHVTGPVGGEPLVTGVFPAQRARNAEYVSIPWRHYGKEHGGHDRFILSMMSSVSVHGDIIKWKHFPRYWPFVRGIHRSPVNSPRKGQWRGALMFPLICVWINGWVNNREAGDLRRHRGHYDVNVMRQKWMITI